MRVPSANGVVLELHDLGGVGPDVLVAHATGFCAGAYRPFASRLAGRGFHVWALDFRAHGSSITAIGSDLSWDAMTDDVLAAADAIGSRPLLGYGHSMGGACLVAAELRRPGTLRNLVVFEPIIVPSNSDHPPGGNQLAASARRRRPSFPSRPDALTRYAGRPPLGSFRADALAAYVEHGFVDTADGTVTLACDPSHEAAVFEAAGKPLIAEVGGVSIPVLVGCGQRDEGPGPADFAPAVAEALKGTLVRYPHVGHFGPFQDPDALADDAAAAFASN